MGGGKKGKKKCRSSIFHLSEGRGEGRERKGGVKLPTPLCGNEKKKVAVMKEGRVVLAVPGRGKGRGGKKRCYYIICILGGGGEKGRTADEPLIDGGSEIKKRGKKKQSSGFSDHENREKRLSSVATGVGKEGGLGMEKPVETK